MNPLPDPSLALRRRGFLAAAGIVLATAAVYSNSFAGPFVFDDIAAIVHNSSIRHLSHLGAVLSPPSGNGITVDGRPVLNLSLALNYALSGTSTGSYHAVNLLIHSAAALVLFGIVRRTIPKWAAVSPRAGDARNHATLIGALVALLWAVHPLQTESVTYVVQRAESLMGLCYLLTLYCFIRAMDAAKQPAAARRWYTLSVLACLLGMGTKEVMISAPLIVLLYDRTFGAGSLAGALRSRSWYYAGLALTAMVVIFLALHTGNRGGTAGFGIDVGLWTYWQTQFQAVAQYLWLSFWPSPLIFDYGVKWARGPADYLPDALAIGALALATGWALWRRTAAGFLGVLFFAILAPTSLVPGNRQTLAEHRMYLALAPVITFAICGGYLLVPVGRRRKLLPLGAAAALALAAVDGFLTLQRNEVYRSELILYRDTVAKRPGNASAHDNLGNALRSAGDLKDAIAEYQTALRVRPDYYQAQYNLAIALAGSGQLPQAIEHYRAALQTKPDYTEAQNNLGIALSRTGQDAEAVQHLTEAIRLNPAYVEAHYNLGLALARTDHMAEAVKEFETTLSLNPNFAPAHTTLGYAYQVQGRTREAQEQFAAAAALAK